jgi:hypothetical protein
MIWEGKSMTREERKYTDTLHRLGPDRPFRMEEEWGPNDTATRTAARKDARRIGFYLVSLWDESGRLVFTRTWRRCSTTWPHGAEPVAGRGRPARSEDDHRTAGADRRGGGLGLDSVLRPRCRCT